jgi:hypothetical protein
MFEFDRNPKEDRNPIAIRNASLSRSENEKMNFKKSIGLFLGPIHEAQSTRPNPLGPIH